MLKVALVVPNFYWCDWDENTRWRFIPYNLCLLAAMIEDRYDVKIIDANALNMDEDSFKKKLDEIKPDVVGITVMMDQYSLSGHFAAKLVKEYDKSLKVVLGGVYATMNSEKAIDDPCIDYVVVGEGEYVFRDLLGFFLRENPIPEKGVVYKQNGSIINTGHSDFIKDLDAIPLPAYHLIDFLSYVSTVPKRKSVDAPTAYPYARILTSRGCPYGCGFCQVESISGVKFRSRSIENILNEIQWMKETYNIKTLIFDDDNLYTKKSRTKSLFQSMIDRNLTMPWISISAAAFRMDEELLKIMKASGCEYINMAIESGNERVLKEIVGKPVDLEMARQVVKMARKEGIYVAVNFIIGFPTETWDEIRETIDFAGKLDADYIKIFAFIPLKNTRLYDLAVDTKSLRKNFSQEDIKWSTGQIETKDFSAEDLTILRAYEWDRINFTEPAKRKRTIERMSISEEELLKTRRETISNANCLVASSSQKIHNEDKKGSFP